MNSSTLALATAVLCLVMSPARAQQPVTPRPLHSVTVETYAFSGLINDQPVTVLTPAIFANIVLSERVSINATWIFAYAPSSNGVPGTFLAGNPSIGPNVVLKGGDLRLRAGGSLVLPFTLLTDADDQQTALLRRAATLRGNSGVSLVAPGLMGLTPWVDASLRQGMFRFGLDFRTPLSVQMSPKRERRMDAVLQLTGSVGLDPHPHLYVGTHMQAIYVTTAAQGVDPTFLALIPFARLHGPIGFVEARLTLNLDAPLGFAFSRNGVWALGLALGTLF